MKILILNGSPAGRDSITLQIVEYLKIFFPKHDYETLHAGQQIRNIEKDFTESKNKLEAADLILFCYPVYTFLVPAQLHRFIELIKESNAEISGKYATQISTSKHFYDTTAHRYIEDICEDLQLKYVRGLSADMEDILTEKGQKEAKNFFSFLLWNIQNGFCETPSVRPAAMFTPVKATTSVIASTPAKMAIPAKASTLAKTPDIAELSDTSSDTSSEISFEKSPAKSLAKMPADSSEKDNLHVALVTDFDPEFPYEALVAMIRRFENTLPGNVEMVNLREYPFKGGCLGCFHCASDGTCVYNDGFSDYLREHINSADAVVFAYTIKDHSMGYRFKLYDDRQFCNGHRTVTMGKPVGYLVDGNLTQEENLRTLMEARAQVGGNYLAGIASDESDPDGQIDRMTMTLV